MLEKIGLDLVRRYRKQTINLQENIYFLVFFSYIDIYYFILYFYLCFYLFVYLLSF